MCYLNPSICRPLLDNPWHFFPECWGEDGKVKEKEKEKEKQTAFPSLSLGQFDLHNNVGSKTELAGQRTPELEAATMTRRKK